MTRKPAAAALIAVSTLALAACSSSGADFDRQSQIGPHPVLPEANQYLVPPMHIAENVGWAGDQKPVVPAGFRVEMLAKDLKSPRRPYVLPNGDILVVESGGPGTEPIERPKDLIMGWVMGMAHGSGKPGQRITILRDTDGDGVPDQRGVFLDHLNSPFGVVLVGSDLYVANTDAIMHYRYRTGQTRITAPGRQLTELPGGVIDHHWTKDLTASPDGSKLYVGVGSNSNILENGKDDERGRAAIWEVDRASGAARIYASGLRNPNGLTFYPGTNTLWAVVNERDELGPNLVPDYMTSVKDGAFYGWPYSYYGQHVDPRVHPQRPDMVAKAIAPDYALSSHVAPLGLTFYTGGNFPAAYRGGAFIGEHGSWDRGEFNGYRVSYVPFANGRPSGKAVPFVTGFLNGDGGARGRPVGVAVDTQGGLLIADDLGGRLWRVVAAECRAFDLSA